MAITADDVLEILKLIEGTHFSELRLEMEGLKLLIGKGPKGGSVIKGVSGMEKNPSGSAGNALSSAAGRKEASGSAEARPLQASASPPEENLISIKAPMLGTFYGTPKPGAPPFVKVGQLVNEDDVVCIIEVMKLFNTVKAGVRGRIAKVCVEQAQVVEFQQPLFWVEPAAKEQRGGSKKPKERAA
jgi:acetyl-CoA carboxylase biotin carboxyl carrier protein